MTPLKSARLLLVASIGFLNGCSDTTTPVSLAGQVGFTYSGALSGNFSASGQLPLTTTDQRTMAWAAGMVENGQVFVDGSAPRTATTYDIIFLGINRMTVGSETIDQVDTGITLMLGAPVGGGLPLQTCIMDAGTIAITEISTSRVKGTFTATGDCFDSSQTATAFTITNGSFDVARVEDIP